ncbi:hypothetical protein [Salinibacterium sp.]|uniref:hypothetical protein n=1 Tax=Salinibacterium sp. TaxID=1915057 RepID=UPI00286ADD42|nr:hypothetical protein [Salinibacterium sp.]
MDARTTHPGERSRGYQVTSQLKRLGIPALGVVLIAVGVALIAQPLPPTASFGWADYSSLSSTPVLVTSLTIAGVTVLGAGMLTMAGWVGYLWGRRTQQRAELSSPV